MEGEARPEGRGWADDLRRPKRWLAHAAEPLGAGPHRRSSGSSRAPGGGREGCGLGQRGATGMVSLDGSRGEGGGQILRTALTLSMLTGRPFRIERIRANRSKPGLRPQHLAAVRAAAKLCGAKMIGDAVDSTRLEFRPGEVEARDIELRIGTAGATTLVLHTVALPLAVKAQRAVRLVLVGGTFNPKAPSFPFLEHTWTRYQEAIGLKVVLAMPQAGFYPKGGGRLEAWIEPGQPRALTLLERGAFLGLEVIGGAARLPRHIPERMVGRVLESLAALVPAPRSQVVDWPGIAPGAACAIVATYENLTATVVAIGERGKPAEVVADEAIEEFLAYDGAAGAVDPHSADQLLLPLALADGRSVFTVSEITEHLRTNAATIGEFLERPIRLEEPVIEMRKPGRVIVG